MSGYAIASQTCHVITTFQQRSRSNSFVGANSFAQFDLVRICRTYNAAPELDLKTPFRYENLRAPLFIHE